jgi:plasmid stabilization system protein ParE
LKVVFAPQAERDLLAAVEFLAARSPASASRLYATVATVVGRLAEGDFEGPEQRLHSGAMVRSWPVSPYRIYYRRLPDEMQIVRIYHQARRPIVR